MRKQYAVGVALFVAGTVFGVLGSQTLFAQIAQSEVPPSTKMIYRGDLQDIPGEEVLVFTSDWAPGNKLPWHMHPNGHEFVYVVEGEQTFEIDGVGQKIVKAGEVLHTQPNVAHFGRNATNAWSKTVVFRIKQKSQPISVEVKKPA